MCVDLLSVSGHLDSREPIVKPVSIIEAGYFFRGLVMKIIISFFIGMIFCLLLVVAVAHYTSNVKAEEDPVTIDDPLNITGLLPDIGKIYRESLGGPYRQVEAEITDPDIAKYYRNLMDRTGLDKIGAE